MKSIGFIDYYIDEWHANNYPQWIRQSAFKDQIDVRYAWEQAPQQGGRPLDQWCQEFQIEPLKSIEEIVEKSDTLIVLAPSNPEVHQRLADLPLRSGKPVYIDKPFTDSLATAHAICDLADKHNTPLMSCSALRYSENLLPTAQAEKDISYAATIGGGSSFWEYSIHQVEMLVALLGTGASRVMQCGNEHTDHMVIEYPDNRRAALTLNPNSGFTWQAATHEKIIGPTDAGDFWPRFIHALLDFLTTGKSSIPRRETLEVTALVETGIAAKKQPGKWLNIIK